MFKKLAAIALLTSACFSANAAIIDVDLELQLLADVSGSVSDSEYALQIQGYANAFRDSSIIDLITDTSNGRIGSIAVQYIEWSSNYSQEIQVDWMLIDSVASAESFADHLDALLRVFDASTGIASAITYGVTLFSDNDYNGTRQVIDVSGDGLENQNGDVAATRDAALAAGIDAINGITIGDETDLSAFYINNVIGGTDSFHIHAETFEDFSTGIELKLKREIAGGIPVPAPTGLALLGLGLLGMSRLRKAK